MVREEGFEPPRACARQVLSLLRLPVPPFPQAVSGPSIAQQTQMTAAFSRDRNPDAEKWLKRKPEELDATSGLSFMRSGLHALHFTVGFQT
jgi:hypothetical protein